MPLNRNHGRRHSPLRHPFGRIETIKHLFALSPPYDLPAHGRIRLPAESSSRSSPPPPRGCPEQRAQHRDSSTSRRGMRSPPIREGRLRHAFKNPAPQLPRRHEGDDPHRLPAARTYQGQAVVDPRQQHRSIDTISRSRIAIRGRTCGEARAGGCHPKRRLSRYREAG
jgi:hypothetical protein